VAMATVFLRFLSQLHDIEHNKMAVLASLKLPSQRKFPDYYEVSSWPLCVQYMA
jgi:hypothetical protein